MRLGNHGGRAALVLDDGGDSGAGDAAAGLRAAADAEVADLATVSDGEVGPDPMDAFERWDLTVEVAAGVTAGTGPLVPDRLRCPVPRPRQVFAIGLNYRDHAEEVGMTVPEVPATFTKFPASLAGPYDEVELVGESVDWEVELVAVVGRRADRVTEADGWSHVAGLTVGQDISDRHLQFAAGGQFSLGKSRRGFGPMGPWVVPVDELDDPEDLELGCAVDGEVLQRGRTADMVVGVPRLIAELSAVLTLHPGDVVFTGTPAGTGMGRQPPRFLRPGQVLESWVEGIGRIRNRLR